MPRPVRVLHLFGRMNRGGAEMRTLDVMRQLDPNHIRLEFCALSGQSGDLDNEIRELGGEVHYCQLDPFFPFKLSRLLREERIDIVHSHVHYSSGTMLAIARCSGVPRRIAHFRSASDGRGNNPLRRLWRTVNHRLVDAFATDIVAVSDSTMRMAWSNEYSSDSRCRVIYNGIVLEQFSHLDSRQDSLRNELGIPADDVIVLHVGNQTSAKNHARVAQIFVEVYRKNPRCRLLLVGREDPTVMNDIHSELATAGVTDALTTVGVRSDVPRLMAGSDVLLFPSLREGLPGVVLEASAAGLPVVASDIPQIREIAELIPGIMLVPLGESNGIWAESLTAAIEHGRDSDLGKRHDELAEAGFTVQHAIGELVSLWKSST